MLGNAGPLDASLVREWMKLEHWQAAYSGWLCAAARFAAAAPRCAAGEPLSQMSARWRMVATARTVYRGFAGTAGVFAHRLVGGGATPGTMAAERRAGSSRRGAVLACVRQATERWHFWLLHGRRIPQGAAAFADGPLRSVVSESWVLGDRVDLDPNGPQMHALERESSRVQGRLCAGMGRHAGGSERRPTAQPVAGGAGPVYSGVSTIAHAESVVLDRPTVDIVGADERTAASARIRADAEQYRTSTSGVAGHAPVCWRGTAGPRYLDERYQALRAACRPPAAAAPISNRCCVKSATHNSRWPSWQHHCSARRPRHHRQPALIRCCC